MPTIHPTAVISNEAQLHETVTVGPYAVIDGPVALGAGCAIGPGVHFFGKVTAGGNNRFHSGCVIGDTPQHIGYSGEPPIQAV